MKKLIILDKKSDFDFPDNLCEVMEADTYLKEAVFLDRQYRVFNLCRDLAYLRKGYYVSLIAEARGHKPLPSISSLMDSQASGISRVMSDNLSVDLNKAFSQIKGDSFELSVFFGQNMATKYSTLSKQIYSLFRSPLLKAKFSRKADGWQFSHVKVLALRDVPEAHRDFLLEAMTSYFSKGESISPKKKSYRYDLAILVNPDEKLPPSNASAIKKFVSAAQDCRLNAEIIGPKDINLLPRFDALFIRETTDVNNHTFRFARRAEEEGLIAIDDSASILRCCNKIYLNYALQKKGLPVPKTLVINNKQDLATIDLDYPVVVKKPDSAFSQGVKKAGNIEELRDICSMYFKDTDLVILQEFLPTEFDWRVGIIDNEPIYVCKYEMAPKHWQIVKSTGDSLQEGGVETLSVGDAPKELIKIAMDSAKMIGDGLYGIDIKQVDNRYFVVEVNDNPSIEKGYEDRICKDYLYRRVMDTFYKRLEMR